MENAMFHHILQAQSKYAKCIDDDRLEDWPSFFTDDCLYRVTTADNEKHGLAASVMFADSRAALIDRITALREANIYERHSYRHILSAPVVLSEAAHEVVSETSFLLVRIMRDGVTDLFLSGRYQDKYCVENDRLLLSERIVVCDSSRIDTLLAIPV
ncbi:MAG: terephthalate 1,2-dioxygenase [Rhodocyclaceae bacterium]|nr:MAG: terephthalate 1,2-dioxygenase [Rhodocyclaceae bacterium]